MLPDAMSQKKEDIQFSKTIEIYDTYEEKLNQLIPFEKRVDNLYDFFVTKYAAREIMI